jgi:hypothetical protein
MVLKDVVILSYLIFILEEDCLHKYSSLVDKDSVDLLLGSWLKCYLPCIDASISWFMEG